MIEALLVDYLKRGIIFIPVELGVKWNKKSPAFVSTTAPGTELNEITSQTADGPFEINSILHQRRSAMQLTMWSLINYFRH
jgi:hypothetical protein